MPCAGSPSCLPLPGLSSYEKGDIKPWQHKQWCIAKVDARFLFQMEDVLGLLEGDYSAPWPKLAGSVMVSA